MHSFYHMMTLYKRGAFETRRRQQGDTYYIERERRFTGRMSGQTGNLDLSDTLEASTLPADEKCGEREG